MIYKKSMERFILADKVKEFNKKIRIIIDNIPKKELVLKDRLTDDCFSLLESVYVANYNKDINNKFKILTRISMIDYYLEVLFNNKYITEKQLRYYCNRLEEITKMVYGWLDNAS